MTMNWIRGPQGFRWVIFGQEANHDETWMDLFAGGELFTSAQYDNTASASTGNTGVDPTDILYASYRPWKNFVREIFNDEWEIAEWVFTTSDGFSSVEDWDEGLISENPVQPSRIGGRNASRRLTSISIALTGRSLPRSVSMMVMWQPSNSLSRR